jgi:DNA helicase-2/ATP-dependent DNA helicase PcrA
MEENLFPSQMSISSRSDLEEERRLFYVAITRAMESCTLSYAGSRFLWNQSIKCEQSRFIDEIDPQFVHFETPTRSQQGRSLMGGGFERSFTGGLNSKLSAPSMPQSLKSISEVKSASPSNSNEFNHIMVGTHVEHSRFGKGRVTQLEGDGADKKAVIFFPHHGSKTVLLKFANLTVL